MKVAFNPKVHGFHFSNNYIKWSFGPIAGKALCGGMIYSALDYFNAGMSIPNQDEVPVEGEPVHKHIYDRQWDAHGNTLYKFLDSWMNNPNSTPQLETLKRWITAGQAVPVCLYKGMGAGHHTLGFSVASDGSFEIYDPNYPNVVVTIRPENGGYRHSMSNDLWYGYFIDDGYTWKEPELLEGEFGWMRCFDCRLMYVGSKGGACPKGGQHNGHGSAKYVLNANAGSGHKGWRKCWKCNGLYFGGDPSSAGICPDGGIHNPVQDLDYTLALGGVGQNNWRRCVNCEGLFWLSGGGIGGICPAGNRHSSDMSKVYTIPFK